MPSKRPIQSTSDKNIESATKKQNKAMRMNGLLVNDEQSLTAMDRECSGDFVPYIPGDKKNSVIEGEDFDRIGRLVVQMLKKAGNSIHSGCVDIKPTDDASGKDACAYCNYRSVCLIRENAEHSKVEKLTVDDAIAKLRGGESGGSV